VPEVVVEVLVDPVVEPVVVDVDAVVLFEPCSVEWPFGVVVVVDFEPRMPCEFAGRDICVDFDGPVGCDVFVGCDAAMAVVCVEPPESVGLPWPDAVTGVTVNATRAATLPNR
jgi:hypothetical protein